jgi:hypothetical protein
MAAENAVFVYETLAPLGEDTANDVANEVLDMPPGFLPLGGGESPREENFVVDRQELTRRSSSMKKVVMTTTEGRNLETLIAAEKNLLNESYTSENSFKARADTSGSSVLGVQETLNTYSVSRTNIQSIGFATEVEKNGDDDETDYISLDLGDGNNVETVVVQEVQEVVVESKGKEVHATGILNMTPQGAPPWARGRDTWIQSPLLQLHQGSCLFRCRSVRRMFHNGFQDCSVSCFPCFKIFVYTIVTRSPSVECNSIMRTEKIIHQGVCTRNYDRLACTYLSLGEHDNCFSVAWFQAFHVLRFLFTR